MKKSVLIFGLVCALFVTTIITAALFTSFNVEMSATMPVVVDPSKVTIGIGSNTYHSGDEINLDWGTLHVGANTQTITITNNANTAVTPVISSSDLPTGWTLTMTLSNGQTYIVSGDSVTATLTLTVPSTALADTYSWTERIDITYTG